MAKFKRSFKPGGFRPEQAGDGGEARLREYSKQVIKGLQQERDAVISDRNRTADVMKQNFQIESQQDKANAKIEQANIQRVIDEQQGISQRALQEFQTQTEASKKIYDAFSSLSTTASKKFAELEVQALEEKGRQEKAEILRLGYNHPLVKGIAKLRKQMSIEQMQGTTELNVAYARGEINELEYTELMKQLNSLTADGKAAILNQLGKEFASFYTQKLNTDEGRKAAGNQQATLEFGQRVLAEWEQINSITGINAALKQDSGYYDKVFSVLQSSSTKAGQIQTANNKTQWVSTWLHTLDNTDSDVEKTEFIEKNWSTLVAYLGAEEAHATLRNAFTRVNPLDGQLQIDPKALTNARIGLTKGKDGEFKTYGEFWPNRIIDIQNTIVDARDKINQRREKVEDDRTRTVAQQFIRELDPTLPMEDRLRKLKDYRAVLQADGKSVPRDLNNAIASAEYYVQDEVISQTAKLDRLIAGKNLTAAEANLFSGEVRKKAFKELLKQNNAKKYGPDFERVVKGLNGDAKKLLNLTGDSATTSKLLRLQDAIKLKWQSWYEDGLRRYGGDEKEAAKFAADLHQKNMDSVTTAGTAYYSKPVSTTDPTIVFPQLEQLRLNTKRQQQNALTDIENKIQSGMGLDQLLRSGAVISQKEMEAASLAINAGESIAPYITDKMRHLVKIYRGKGLEVRFSDLINRSIQLHNQRNPNNQILSFPVPKIIQEASIREAKTRTQVARIEAEINQQQMLRNQNVIRPSMRNAVTIGNQSGYVSGNFNDKGDLQGGKQIHEVVNEMMGSNYDAKAISVIVETIYAEPGGDQLSDRDLIGRILQKMADAPFRR
jgi:hypothetical protein